MSRPAPGAAPPLNLLELVRQPLERLSRAGTLHGAHAFLDAKSGVATALAALGGAPALLALGAASVRNLQQGSCGTSGDAVVFTDRHVVDAAADVVKALGSRPPVGGKAGVAARTRAACPFDTITICSALSEEAHQWWPVEDDAEEGDGATMTAAAARHHSGRRARERSSSAGSARSDRSGQSAEDVGGAAAPLDFESLAEHVDSLLGPRAKAAMLPSALLGGDAPRRVRIQYLPLHVCPLLSTVPRDDAEAGSEVSATGVADAPAAAFWLANPGVRGVFPMRASDLVVGAGAGGGGGHAGGGAPVAEELEHVEDATAENVPPVARQRFKLLAHLLADALLDLGLDVEQSSFAVGKSSQLVGGTLVSLLEERRKRGRGSGGVREAAAAEPTGGAAAHAVKPKRTPATLILVDRSLDLVGGTALSNGLDRAVEAAAAGAQLRCTGVPAPAAAHVGIALQSPAPKQVRPVEDTVSLGEEGGGRHPSLLQDWQGGSGLAGATADVLANAVLRSLACKSREAALSDIVRVLSAVSQANGCIVDEAELDGMPLAARCPRAVRDALLLCRAVVDGGAGVAYHYRALLRVVSAVLAAEVAASGGAAARGAPATPARWQALESSLRLQYSVLEEGGALSDALEQLCEVAASHVAHGGADVHALLRAALHAYSLFGTPTPPAEGDSSKPAPRASGAPHGAGDGVSDLRAALRRNLAGQGGEAAAAQAHTSIGAAHAMAVAKLRAVEAKLSGVLLRAVAACPPEHVPPSLRGDGEAESVSRLEVRIERVLEHLREVGAARWRLRDWYRVHGADPRTGAQTYSPLAGQVVRAALQAGRPPLPDIRRVESASRIATKATRSAVSSAAGLFGRLGAAAVGLLATDDSEAHPSDNAVVVVFVLGGLRGADVAGIRAALSDVPGDVARRTQVLVGGSCAATGDALVDLALGESDG